MLLLSTRVSKFFPYFDVTSINKIQGSQNPVSYASRSLEVGRQGISPGVGTNKRCI